MRQIDILLEDYKQMKETMKSKLSDSLKAYFKTYFEENPEIKTIYWNQYTPYFNDGDPCEFTVNEVYETNCDDISHLSHWGEYEGEDENVTVDYSKEISNIICSREMEDVMNDMFGDHVTVYCTREGFELHQLNHD